MPRVPGAPKKKGRFSRPLVNKNVRKNLMSVADEAFEIFREHWLKPRVKTTKAASVLVAALKRTLTKQFKPKRRLKEIPAWRFYGYPNPNN